MNVLVGVPVYNEVDYIDRVLDEVRRYCPNIFVVDDGSTDGTGEKLAARTDVRVHTHLANQGYGQSLIDIFDAAAAAGYDWVITLDADEQHEPRAIEEFVRVAAEGDADIVSGSRYLDEPEADVAPSDRRWVNQQITRLLCELTGYELTDAFCGFKAYRVEAVDRLRLTEQGYSMPLQLWIAARRAGLRVREIPIRLIYKDPNRRFGGGLDDTRRRIDYYLETISREIGRPVEWPTDFPADDPKAECTCR